MSLALRGLLAFVVPASAALFVVGTSASAHRGPAFPCVAACTSEAVPIAQAHAKRGAVLAPVMIPGVLGPKIGLVYDVTQMSPPALCNATVSPTTGPGTGGYASGNDDTGPIQQAALYATKYGGTIYIPGPDNMGHTGKCAISAPIFAGGNNVTLAGAGKYLSELVAMPAFAFNPATTPYSTGTKQYNPMIDLDQSQAPVRPFNSGQPPLVGMTIRDLGFDPRAVNNSQGNMGVVMATVRGLQDFTAENLYFDLGEPLSFSDVTKTWQGIAFDVLQFDPNPANYSHDLYFRNITCHNGVGCNILRSGAGFNPGCGAASPVVAVTSHVRVENEVDLIDVPIIEDDRDTWTMSPFCPSANPASDHPTFQDYVNTGQMILISDTVTGTQVAVNGLKIEANAYGVIKQLSYGHVFYRGSANATYVPTPAPSPLPTATPLPGAGQPRGTGAIVAMEDLSGSGAATSVQTDMNFFDIHGDYAAGLGIVPQGNSSYPISMTVSDVDMENDMGGACVLIIASQPPSSPAPGTDFVHLNRIHCSPSAANLTENSPIGVEFTQTGYNGAGFLGSVGVTDSSFIGYPNPVSIYNNKGAFNSIVFERVTWNTGTPAVIEPTTVWRDSTQNNQSFGLLPGGCSSGATLTGGPNFSTGVGPPACSAASGSVYIRTDGTLGARVYVNQGGSTWTPVAGV